MAVTLIGSVWESPPPPPNLIVGVLPVGLLAGRVFDRKVLRRLSKRQLVELIEAKDVELIAWDEAERLELIAEDYLADEGTHVSLSASEEAARHTRRPRTLIPVAAALTCLALCAGAVRAQRW